MTWRGYLVELEPTLAVDLPVAVVHQLFGVSVAAAVLWARHASSDRNGYVAALLERRVDTRSLLVISLGLVSNPFRGEDGTVRVQPLDSGREREVPALRKDLSLRSVLECCLGSEIVDPVAAWR